ncbi:DUF928 domain-containing protein [Aerosakkonemataceae cyanobacterium BLCC-F50]|uniref:DUF928 domain-containing protein n=1 Tax=Floridaenema flaviceps BLCC-F50 TaxID=3153642 RepID=A0ABV4Y2D3_9CYAN
MNMKLALTGKTLLVSLGLGLAIAPNLITEVKGQNQQVTPVKNLTREVSQSYQPPDRSAPSTTAGGASRGGCIESAGVLTSLMPQNNLGLTLSGYPTFFWYVPKSKAEALEFKLLDGENGKVIYKKTLAVPSNSGIVSFTLPKDELSAPLEVGKMYHWFLTMVCPPNPNQELPDKSGNVIVDGWVERIQLNPSLVNKLEKAAPTDRPALYAAAGIWHESLTTLVDLLRQKPDDRNLKNQWKKLLDSVGLNVLVEKPMLDCCTSKPN